MTVSLTDSDAYTSPVVVAADGEAANSASLIQGFQPLANRTHYLNQRRISLEAVVGGVGKTFANLGVSGGLVAAGVKFGLFGTVTGGDAAITGGDTLTFSQAGLYWFAAQMAITAGDVANPVRTGFNVDVGGSTVLGVEGDRLSGNPDHFVFLSASLVIAAAAGTALSLKARFGHTAGTNVNNGSLSIIRIK